MLPEPALTIFRLTPFLLFWWLRVTPMKSHSHFLIIRSLYFFFFLRARFDLRIWFLFWPASLVTLCLFSLLSGLAAAALASLTLFLFFVRSFFIAFLSIRIFSMTHDTWDMEPRIWDICVFGTWHLGRGIFGTTHLGQLPFWTWHLGQLQHSKLFNHTSGTFAFLERDIWEEGFFGTAHLGRSNFGAWNSKWNYTSGKGSTLTHVLGLELTSGRNSKKEPHIWVFPFKNWCKVRVQ